MGIGTNLVNGQWLDPSRRHQVLNPVDGSHVGSVGYGDAHLADEAATAAAASFEAWASTPARDRADLLNKAAQLIMDRADEIGLLLAREAGKRLPEAVGEVRFAAEYFRWFAEESRRSTGSVIPQEVNNRRHLTLRRPAGVVASLTPWNFPCSIQARKLAPALAAGCTVVARVSEKAPLAVTEMIRSLTDAGLPAGVVNLVHGPAAEVTEAYLAHPAVRVVSFTGSTQVGQQIMRLAADRVVRPLLELGGDAAFIVCDDADLDEAVEGAMLAKFRNTGQSCIGANRFLVQDGVYDEFVSRFASRISALSVGDGLADPTPDLGPCIDDSRVKDVSAMVQEALDRGAAKVSGNVRVPETGSFCEPALLVDVPDDCGLAQREVFGPAAAVFRFTDEQHAIELANRTEMGLAGYLYTRDIARLWRMSERLDVGILGVNEALPSVCFAPMGGVKQSGLGREGSHVGLEEFEEIRYLAVGIQA